MISLLIKSAAKILRKAGRLEAAAAILVRALDRLPHSIPLFHEYCVNRMTARDFSAITRQCRTVASIFSYPASGKASDEALKDAAVFWLTRSCLEDNPQEEVLHLLQNRFRRAADTSVELLQEGRIGEARQAFLNSLKLAGIPRDAMQEWALCFEVLFGLSDKEDKAAGSSIRNFDNSTKLGAGEKDRINPPLSGAASVPQSVPKIVVSGMYWSGSGALYDFFREFDQVSAISGELRLWKEGDFCLNALQRKIDKPKDKLKARECLQTKETVDGSHELLKKELWRFLLLALAGISSVHNWQEEMASGYALSAAREDCCKMYAAACRRFVQEAQNSFVPASVHLSDALARIWSGSIKSAGVKLKKEVMLNTEDGNRNWVLFDNIVHIGGIEAVRLLGEARVFCVFRDPRSNFVSRWYENPRFHRDVDRYISYYRSTVQHFERTLAESPDIASIVHRVSFERFILSEEYRNSLAASCGLGLNERSEGSCFRSEVSRKNIALYHSFFDQSAVKKIERELGEYCIELPAATKG